MDYLQIFLVFFCQFAVFQYGTCREYIMSSTPIPKQNVISEPELNSVDLEEERHRLLTTQKTEVYIPVRVDSRMTSTGNMAAGQAKTIDSLDVKANSKAKVKAKVKANGKANVKAKVKAKVTAPRIRRSVSKWWPGGIVPYVIDDYFRGSLNDVIVSAMRQLEKEVQAFSKNPCVRFVERSTEKQYVKIVHGVACHATVGFQERGHPTIYLGDGCITRGVLLHELMHILGFLHEQNRPDRDEYVEIRRHNIRPGFFSSNFHKFPESVADTFGLAYDLQSVLHYGPYAMASRPDTPVMTPKLTQGPNVVMGQRDDLSPYDVMKVQKAYGCPLDVGYRVVHPLDYVVNCPFTSDVCNMALVDTGSKVKWKVQNGATANGPKAGHSTGVDSYLVAKDDGGQQNNAGDAAMVETPLSLGGPFCLDFFVFQKGPSSYLDIVVSGVSIRKVTVRSLRGVNGGYWKRELVGINVDPGVKVKVSLVARIKVGVVAVDDFKMRPGKCGW